MESSFSPLVVENFKLKFPILPTNINATILCFSGITDSSRKKLLYQVIVEKWYIQ